MIAHKKFDAMTLETSGAGERSVVARISTIDIDRDGDVMMPGGIRTEEFRQNPGVLFGPDSGAIPTGKAGGIQTQPELHFGEGVEDGGVRAIGFRNRALGEQ